MKNLQKLYPLLYEDREKTKSEKTQRRYECAWKCANEAAVILKEQFSCSEVIVFGSLSSKKRFHLGSDIDIAVSGIEPDRFWAAVAMLTRLIPDFKVDLVDINYCKPMLRQTIEKEGISL